MSSTTSAPVASAAGRSACASARAPRKRAPASLAQIAAEMALARAFRPDQDDRTRRPVGPALDQRQRRRVGRTAEEVLAREALGMVERKRELTRAMGGHRGQSGVLAGIERAREIASARSGTARRSPPPAAPRSGARRSRTGSRRRTSRRSARPDASRHSRRPASAPGCCPRGTVRTGRCRPPPRSRSSPARTARPRRVTARSSPVIEPT